MCPWAWCVAWSILNSETGQLHCDFPHLPANWPARAPASQSENRHFDVAPKTAAGRIDRATNLSRGSVDISNVDRRHLRTEVKQSALGNRLPSGAIHTGEDNPIFR